MITVEVDDINELLYEACNNVMMYGKEVEVRGMKTKELHPFHATVNNPTKRTLLYPYRGNNPFGTLFETLWVLGAKDNSIEHLKDYVPRAPMFSDDGKRWRAGYPERLRNYGVLDTVKAINGVDQFRYVYEKLKADPETRQAVINLWNPLLDDFELSGLTAEQCDKIEHGDSIYNNVLLKVSLDFPCSQNLTFVIRDGKLDCTFYIRSNDAIYGCTAINLYEFTVMQELLAGMLDVEIGKFYYYINSLHIYEDKYDKAKQIIQEGKPYDDFLMSITDDTVTRDEIPVFKWYFNDLIKEYDKMMCLYETLYHDVCSTENVEYAEQDTRGDIYRLCKIYMKYKDKDFTIDTWIEYMKEMEKVRYTDLKVACHFWMGKKMKCIKRDGIEVAMQQMKLQGGE